MDVLQALTYLLSGIFGIAAFVYTRKQLRSRAMSYTIGATVLFLSGISITFRPFIDAHIAYVMGAGLVGMAGILIYAVGITIYAYFRQALKDRARE